MTETAIPEGWAQAPAAHDHAHVYTNPFFSNWKIYHPEDGPYVVLRDGEPYATEFTLPDAVQQVEESGQIPIRRRTFEEVGDRVMQDSAAEHAAAVAASASNEGREIPAEELKALTTIEVASSGLLLAIQILHKASDGPVSDVDRLITRASTLLSLLASETTTRVQAATQQTLTPAELDAAARYRLAQLVARLDALTAQKQPS